MVYQSGGAVLDGIGSVYSGSVIKVQRGRGFKDFFLRAYRTLKPIFLAGSRAAGRQILSSSGKILTDLGSAERSDTPANIIKKHVLEGSTALASGALQKMTGGRRSRRAKSRRTPRKRKATRQTGKGRKKKQRLQTGGRKRARPKVKKIMKRRASKKQAGKGQRRKPFKKRTLKMPRRLPRPFKPDVFNQL